MAACGGIHAVCGFISPHPTDQPYHGCYYGLGFITGLLAATLLHAEPARNLNPTANEMYEEHEAFAYLTIWLSGFAAAAKMAGLFLSIKWVEAVAAILRFGSAVTVSIAWHYGSALVFKQGAGPEGNMFR